MGGMEGSGRGRSKVGLALASVLVLLATQTAFAATTADYRFNDSLASSAGSSAALTQIGDCSGAFITDDVGGTTARAFAFGRGGGLALSPTTGVIPNDSYTIVVLFKFDETSGYDRILDFLDGTSDTGLYSLNGDLVFYGAAGGTGTPIQPDTYVQVVITRDANGTVFGYVDGVQQFTFTDSGSLAVISPESRLRFFRDNEFGANSEHTSGVVARIRLFDTPLTSDEVDALDRLPSASPGSPGGARPVCGTTGADTITGTDEDDVISSGDGDDIVSAGGGDDVVDAGAGNDDVDAGGGNDEVTAGAGNDTADGGGGADRINGGGGADVIKGGKGKDKLIGGKGKDTCVTDGNDTLRSCEFTKRHR